MAPFCPARKLINKEKTKEMLTNKETAQSQTNNFTTTTPSSTFTGISYAQITSKNINQQAPLISQQTPLITPTNEIPSFANITACMIYAHIENTINPGTFNKTLHEIMQANKLNVTLQFPDNPQSSQQVLNLSQQTNAISTTEDNSTSSENTSNSSEKTLIDEEASNTATEQDTTTSSQELNTSELLTIGCPRVSSTPHKSPLTKITIPYPVRMVCSPPKYKTFIPHENSLQQSPATAKTTSTPPNKTLTPHEQSPVTAKTTPTNKQKINAPPPTKQTQKNIKTRQTTKQKSKK
ncbi:unnamed protein product [Rotaria magnacalcarata]|uniref:Uncharacterized protein n=1 Tax=Rotaria magnacalcarata TaxID=392030 RepID=A0A817AMM6_9BILA|nr:unnamed protein product [Rotaria magnacalcarata]CAF4145744.1 unnamed protein product [Rotaria magnacalcarata]